MSTTPSRQDTAAAAQSIQITFPGDLSADRTATVPIPAGSTRATLFLEWTGSDTPVGMVTPRLAMDASASHATACRNLSANRAIAGAAGSMTFFALELDVAPYLSVFFDHTSGGTGDTFTTAWVCFE